MARLLDLRLRGASWDELRQVVNYQWKVTTRDGTPWSASRIYRAVHREAVLRGIDLHDESVSNPEDNAQSC